MKLISCEGCGVVLDTDQISAENEEHEYYPKETYLWCPCCKCKVDYFTGNEL